MMSCFSCPQKIKQNKNLEKVLLFSNHPPPFAPRGFPFYPTTPNALLVPGTTHSGTQEKHHARNHPGNPGPPPGPHRETGLGEMDR